MKINANHCKKTLSEFTFFILTFTLLSPIHSTLQATSISENFPDFFDATLDNNKLFNKSFAQNNPSWVLARDLYDTCLRQSTDSKLTQRIPQTFHLIWIGKQVPDYYVKLIDQIKKLHPTYTVKLWTDKDISTYPFSNKKAFDAATNYAEKADIWRYEILYKEGGIYIDGDYLFLKPIDDLVYMTDFFTAISQDTELTLGNFIIGAIPAHPILKHCIDEITISNGNNNPENIMHRSGPYHFTRCFLKSAHDGNFINVAFPPSFFNPWPHYFSSIKEPTAIKNSIKPYSRAIHLWAVTWQQSNLWAVDWLKTNQEELLSNL